MHTRAEWEALWVSGLTALQEQAHKQGIDETWPDEFHALVADLDAALATYSVRRENLRESIGDVLVRLAKVAKAMKDERDA